jgi:hypothetical protein
LPQFQMTSPLTLNAHVVISCQRAQQEWRNSRVACCRRAKMKEQANNSVGLSMLLLPSAIGISLLSTFNSSYELFQYCLPFLCSLLSTGYPRLISGLVPTFCMHDTWGHRAAFWPPQLRHRSHRPMGKCANLTEDIYLYSKMALLFALDRERKHPDFGKNWSYF